MLQAPTHKTLKYFQVLPCQINTNRLLPLSMQGEFYDSMQIHQLLDENGIGFIVDFFLPFFASFYPEIRLHTFWFAISLCFKHGHLGNLVFAVF